MDCHHGDEWVSSAVVEPISGDHCPACPQIAGCYRLRGDAELPILPFAPRPDEVFVRFAQRGCRFELEPPDGIGSAALSGWVEPDGSLSLHIDELVGGVRGMACLAVPRNGEYSTLSCQLYEFEGPMGAIIEAELTRVGDAECDG